MCVSQFQRVIVRVIGHLYSALLWDELIARRSDMARDSKGITQFYLPPTYKLVYLPLLPSGRSHRPSAGTHCAHPWRDGQAKLTWVTGYILR